MYQELLKYIIQIKHYQQSKNAHHDPQNRVKKLIPANLTF